MPYERSYSVTEIKQLLTESERWGGHGKSLHHDISDREATRLRKSAFQTAAWTNASRTDHFQTGRGRNRIWRSREIALYTRTKSDQAFMVALVLNSAFGQAALRQLDRPGRSRIVIHAWPMKMGMGMPPMSMRTPNRNGVVNNDIGRLVIIIESGWAQPHIVTAYPTATISYNFKFGPRTYTNQAQSLPGVEHTYVGGRRIWQWSTHNQNSGYLIPRWTGA
jgi:hypothetical protein